MPRFTVPYRTSVTLSVDVDAPDWDTAVQRADELVRIDLCPTCASKVDLSKDYELLDPLPEPRQHSPIDSIGARTVALRPKLRLI